VTPVWNHSEVLSGYQDGDALEFVVKDSDTGKPDDLLGNAKLPSKYIANGFDGELPLTDAGKGIQAFLKVQVSPTPPGAAPAAPAAGAAAGPAAPPTATAKAPLAPPPPKKVYVYIASARGLRDADTMIGMGTSDPYCLCGIAGKPKVKKIQTKTLDNTVTPVWNHNGELDGYQDGDALEFEVKDSDTGKSDDLLGKVSLSAAEVVQGFDGEKQLAEAGKGISAFLRMKVSLQPISSAPAAAAAPSADPKAKASTAPAAAAPPKAAAKAAAAAPGDSKPISHTAHVTIVSASGLRDADALLGQGTSDPYCVCSIAGQPRSEKKRTKTVDNNANPVWNETFTLSGLQEGNSLLFEVNDADTGKTDDFLGRASLDWLHISKGYSGKLTLLEAGKGINATLEVRVSLDSAGPVTQSAQPPPAPSASAAGAAAPSASPPPPPGQPAAAAKAAAPKAAVVQQPASSASAPPAPQADAAAAAQQAAAGPAPPKAPAPTATPPPAAAKRTHKVSVKITSAANLRNADVGFRNKSDPYCVVEIQGKPASQIKTAVVNDNLNPVWNFQGELAEFEEGNALIFNVFDDDYGKDDHLGKAELTSAQVLAGFSGQLPLETKDKQQASITISVQVQP